MLNIVLAALLIAATLTAYTVHTILSYKPRHARDADLPSQAFIRSFAEPISHVQVVAQKVSHHEERTSVDFDWSLAAEESLTQRHIHIPTGAEFDAWERLRNIALDLDALLGPVDVSTYIAAKVDDSQPAKKVRVYDLARECSVDSKFMRTVLEHQFSIATKSPSSTVTQEQAASVIEFFATHADI